MTAQLVQAYKAAGDDRNFEIVLFGHDSDHDAMVNYMKDSDIPFLGVKKSEADKVAELAKLGESGYLPLVVLANPNGELVTTDVAQVIAALK